MLMAWCLVKHRDFTFTSTFESHDEGSTGIAEDELSADLFSFVFIIKWL